MGRINIENMRMQRLSELARESKCKYGHEFNGTIEGMKHPKKTLSYFFNKLIMRTNIEYFLKNGDIRIELFCYECCKLSSIPRKIYYHLCKLFKLWKI